MKKNWLLSKEIVSVSIPLIGGMVGNLVMMFVDRLCLARYSEATLAASGPAVFTAMTIISFFSGVAAMGRSFVAQAHGKSGDDEAEKEGSLGIVLAIALAILLLALGPLFAKIPLLSNRPANIVQLESDYIRWAIIFGAAMVVNIGCSSFLNGIGKTRTPFLIGVMGQLLDVFFTVGLVFGKFGLPEMGMVGSAVGTIIGAGSMTVAYFIFLPRSVITGLRDSFRLVISTKAKVFKERLRTGIPAGGALGLDELGQTGFVWIVGFMGPVALSANNLNLTINYIGIIPIIGLGIGCSILAATAIGANDRVRLMDVIKTTVVIEIAYVACMGVIQVFFADVLLSPFGLAEMSPEIAAAARSTTRWLWTYSFAFVFSMTGATVLESFGITRFTLGTRAVFMWLLSLPLIYYVASSGPQSPDRLILCWIIGSVFEILIGIVLFLRIAQAIRRNENSVVLTAATDEAIA